MSGEQNDPVVDRAIDALRRLPDVEPLALRRVVEAAGNARVTPADPPIVRSPARRTLWAWTATGIAAAIIGFAARGIWESRGRPLRSGDVSIGAAPSATRLRNASSQDVALLAIPRQFVFTNPSARRVSLVGDFNGWNPSSTPMTRSGSDGLWSVIVPIVPGRHVYGFMIDDSLFSLDPRMPKVRDPDFGTERSVVIVGRP